MNNTLIIHYYLFIEIIIFYKKYFKVRELISSGNVIYIERSDIYISDVIMVSYGFGLLGYVVRSLTIPYGRR